MRAVEVVMMMMINNCRWRIIATVVGGGLRFLKSLGLLIPHHGLLTDL